MKWWGTILTLLALPGLRSADAAVYSVQFSGTISEIYAETTTGNDASTSLVNILPFRTGDRFSGRSVYDTGIADSNPDPTIGIYDIVHSAPGDFRWDIAGSIADSMFQNVAGGRLMVRVLDGVPSTGLPDRFILAPIPQLPTGWSIGTSSSRLASDSLRFELASSSDLNVFVSDALPTSLNLSDFDERRVEYSVTPISGSISNQLTTPWGTFSGGTIRIVGTLDLLSVSTVPEPAGAVIWLALGLLGTLVASRRIVKAELVK